MARAKARKRRIPRLDRVLAYRHAEVVHRFCANWNVEHDEAAQIFDDLKRFLWVASQTDAVFPPVPIVDEMWHMFLVYTKDYAAFCDRFFGRMLHHEPTSSRAKRAGDALFATRPDTWRARRAKQLHGDMALVHAKLGEAVMLRWYVDYAERFGRGFFQRNHLASCSTFRFPRSLKRRSRRVSSC